jgi:hypothetical protein
MRYWKTDIDGQRGILFCEPKSISRSDDNFPIFQKLGGQGVSSILGSVCVQ